MYRCRRLNKSTGGGSSWQTSDITLGGKHTLVLGPEYVVNTGATEPLGKQRFFENKGFLKAKGSLETRSERLHRAVNSADPAGGRARRICPAGTRHRAPSASVSRSPAAPARRAGTCGRADRCCRQA